MQSYLLNDFIFIFDVSFFKKMPHSVVIKIWAAFIANFGGKPFKCKIDHITSYKTLLYASFLDGVIIWICYRAFLFSELSSKINKYPFSNLDTLAKSDYKYEIITIEYIICSKYHFTIISPVFVGYSQVLRILQYLLIYQV